MQSSSSPSSSSRSNFARSAAGVIASTRTLGSRVDNYRVLAAAARASGNIAEAQYQTANYLFERGDLRGAVEQINAGLRVASISNDDRARLLARRKQMIDTIPKDELRALQKQG